MTPGWFGKLPMLGDFAHRRLPPPFVSACDAWLSQGMAASREALGAGWQDSYLTAPLWCFAWSPRIVDEQWWFGVLMPSVDAVGRYFPLLLAFSADHAPTQPDELSQWTQWYEGACRCALQALQDGATLDGFEAALATIGAPAMAEAADGTLRSLAARVHDHSLWWPHLPDDSAPPVTVMQRLPAAGRFAAMLEGAL